MCRKFFFHNASLPMQFFTTRERSEFSNRRCTFNPGFNSVLNQHNETEDSNTYFLLGENCFEEAQNMIIKFISLRVTDISIELFTEAL